MRNRENQFFKAESLMTNRMWINKQTKKNEIPQSLPMCRNRKQGPPEERRIKQLRMTDKKGGLLEYGKAGC